MRTDARLGARGGALQLAGTAVVTGCSGGKYSKAVYLLLDICATYAKEVEPANAIVNYLWGTLRNR